MVAAGSLFLSAGCISWGSPSQGIIEIKTSQIDYSVSLEVTRIDETVLDETYSLTPNNPIKESFEFEQEADYSVQIEFEPALQAINIGESAANQGWTAESGDIHGELNFSSSDQVFTVSIDDTETASVEYEAVHAA